MNKNKEIFKTFFREKPAMMLVELKNAKSEVYASSLAKVIDCTYSHVVKILQEMEHGGKGVHNPAYAKALLNESIKKLQ